MANDCTTARHIATIAVIDPESGGSVDLSVYKHDNGGLFAIDASYLVYGSPRLVAGDDSDPLIPDPFDDEGRAMVRLADGFVSDPGDGETGPTTGRRAAVEPPVALPAGGREAPTDEEVRGRVYTHPCTPDDWRSFVRAMRSGDPVEMDSGMWEYWLNALPPVYMDRTIDGRHYSFGAAEGREAVVDFWREGGRLYCRRSERINDRA